MDRGICTINAEANGPGPTTGAAGSGKGQALKVLDRAGLPCIILNVLQKVRGNYFFHCGGDCINGSPASSTRSMSEKGQVNDQCR